MIGIPTNGIIRHSPFIDYYHQLIKPDNTAMSFSHGASPAKSRNMIIESALDNGFTHILFMDDDVAPNPDGLMKLLAHDKDIVTGLYLMRNYPHLPVVFDDFFEDGKCRHLILNGHSGLQQVVNCGFGFVLIKTSVFQKMAKPWVTLGEIEKDGWCDDISFFNRARAAGFNIYCDFDCLVGHITTSIITPAVENNEWFTKYNTGSIDAIQVPQVTNGVS